MRAAAVVAGAVDQGLVWPVTIEREGANGSGFSAFSGGSVRALDMAFRHRPPVFHRSKRRCV
jgi:hypothetical protein